MINHWGTSKTPDPTSIDREPEKIQFSENPIFCTSTENAKSSILPQIEGSNGQTNETQAQTPHKGLTQRETPHKGLNQR